jgi:DNA-binding response OmpR family regulator
MKENKISRAGASASAAPQCQTNPPQRILMVEDDVDIRRLNTEVLTESGYHVDAAEDGVAAWQSLNTDSYDLLITDNDMPMVTGMELIKKMRAEDITLPVILMSGTLPTEELRQHPWLQIQALLQKPYTLADLFRTVKEVLGAPSGGRRQLAPPPGWRDQPSAAGLQR